MCQAPIRAIHSKSCFADLTHAPRQMLRRSARTLLEQAISTRTKISPQRGFGVVRIGPAWEDTDQIYCPSWGDVDRARVLPLAAEAGDVDPAWPALDQFRASSKGLEQSRPLEFGAGAPNQSKKAGVDFCGRFRSRNVGPPHTRNEVSDGGRRNILRNRAEPPSVHFLTCL